jgi:L-lactate dehydrogenase (cytochrome)
VEPDTAEKVVVEITDEEKARQERISNRPPLDEILNLHDFEVLYFLVPCSAWSNKAVKNIARQVLPEKAWAYYSSAADDEITNRENHAAYHRFLSTIPRSIVRLNEC